MAATDDDPTNMGTLTPHVLAYIGGRQRRGELQPITVRSVRNHLMKFSASYGKRPLTQLSPKAVERYIEQMRHRDYAPGTIAAHLSSMRTFARWCVLERIVDRDWMLAAPKVRRPRQVPRDMENEHFYLALGAARTPRERLIAWLWFGCGLRCVEVSRLHVDDYDPVTHYLFVTGKAGHERHVPAPTVVVAAMQTYLAEAGHASGHLIRRETDGGGPVSPERISGIGQRLCRDAGIKVRPYDGRSAHGFRAAAVSDLIDHGGDILTGMEFMGHANLQTMHVYLRRGKLAKVAAAQDARNLHALDMPEAA